MAIRFREKGKGKREKYDNVLSPFTFHLSPKIRGFTLIEALVSISILALAIIGPLSLASTSMAAAQIARDQLVAFYLSQEGIEIVRNQRDTNRVDGAHTWYYGWLNTCNSTEGKCATIVDGSESTVERRIKPLNCVWHSTSGVALDEPTITDCLGKTDAILRYNTNTSSSGDQIGLYGHNTSLGWDDTGFSRVVFVMGQTTDREVTVTSITRWTMRNGNARTVRLTEKLFHLEQ